MPRTAFATRWSGLPRAWSSTGKVRAKICRSSRSPRPKTASRSRHGRRGSSWPAVSTSRRSCRPRAWRSEAKVEVTTGLPGRPSLRGRKRSSWKLRIEWFGNNWDGPNAAVPEYVQPNPHPLRNAAASPARGIPSTDVREDVVMVPRDLLSRRFVHVDERKLGPGRMLPDLIPFSQKHEFEIPVILRPVHFGEHMRAVQRVTRQTELLLQDSIRGRLRRLAEDQMRGRKHPAFAGQRGSFWIERSDVIPPRRRIEMTHEDAVSMAALAQDDERGQTNPTLRDLPGLQRSVRGSEATELAVRGHDHRTPPRAFQPCCTTESSVSAESSGDGRKPFITRATSTAASPRTGSR